LCPSIVIGGTGSSKRTRTKARHKIENAYLPKLSTFLGMCHVSVLKLFISNVKPKEFESKSVIEVGSRYVNGSVREFIEKFGQPNTCIGVDMEAGKFVDEVLSAENLISRFGESSFDIVVSTEL